MPILTKDEEVLILQIQSLRFIPKVTFLCTVSRPRFDDYNNVIFNRKIGPWRFVER